MATPCHVSESGLERFQDDRFGMFVHWGLYSLIGANEWVMFRERYSAEEYVRLTTRFEAAAFDADALVHKVTKTPFGRDPIAEIAAACGRHGVRLALYVSLLDCHHPAYPPHLRDPTHLSRSDYLANLNSQLPALSPSHDDA